jgi:hypothetical protein
MRVVPSGRRAPERGGRPARPGIALAAAILVAASAARAGQEAAPSPGQRGISLTGQYVISAHVVFLGSLGGAGSMVIESAREQNAGRLRKTLRLAGSSTPEQAKKNRDYSGDFSLLKLFPLRPDGSVDEQALAEDRWVESSSAGFLKTNKKSQSEQITFFPDHALVVRAGKPDVRVEGSYGCLLSPLEYLMDHDIKAGQVIDVPFILNGVPRIFRMEVAGQTTLSPLKARAYEIALYAVDLTGATDKASKEVWRKKGNLRIWFCKEGPYRNQMLRMKIKFRWYLSLVFDLQKPAAG